MKALLSFFFSKDGVVALGVIFLLSVISTSEGSSEPVVNFAGRVGNLVVFLYILWRVGGKAMKEAVSGRRAKIAEEFSSLETRKQEAAQRLADLEKRLSGMEAERAAILEESERQARVLREAIIAEAEADAKRIREHAVLAAESEARASRDALQARLADEIVLAVEKALRERLDAPSTDGEDSGENLAHVALIDNALKRVVLH